MESIKITTPLFMLCQNCLRVSDYDPAGHNEEYFCKCGGQWCGCDSCNDTAEQLNNGERDSKKLYLQGDHEIIEWSKEDGIKG